MEFSFANKACAACGKPLTGRIDKKFCDDQCRSSFNNQNKRSYEQMIMETNRALRRNRTILKTLCPTGKATVRKSVLADLGFSFQLFNTIFRSKENTYYFSHEFGYMPITDEKGIKKVVIIQKQDYMNKPFDPWG